MRRVLCAVVVGIAALALAPAAGAQSLGEVAAREKEKRKAKTGKVYSDNDLRKGGGEASADASSATPGSAPSRPAGEAGTASSETATTEGTSDEQVKADKARADNEKAWRERWTKANDEYERAKGELSRMLEAYNKMPETMRDQALLDTARKKADAAEQALSALDEERRKSGFAR